MKAEVGQGTRSHVPVALISKSNSSSIFGISLHNHHGTITMSNSSCRGGTPSIYSNSSRSNPDPTINQRDAARSHWRRHFSHPTHIGSRKHLHPGLGRVDKIRWAPSAIIRRVGGPATRSGEIWLREGRSGSSSTASERRSAEWHVAWWERCARLRYLGASKATGRADGSGAKNLDATG